MAIIIETSIGHLTVDLYTDERPRCAKNFLKLCKVKYYNFSLFHSVQQNLVAQTGDPTATGRGGMSVYGMLYGEQARYFDMEVTPRIKHKKRGQLSMVNNGAGKHGSQFFITLGKDLDYLDGEHTVFGEVAEGFEVLDKLNEAYCDDKHRPYRDIRIFHTVVIEDPFDDPEGLVIPDKSPEPTQEMLESDRIGVDEEVDDTKGMTEKEIQEMQAEREAKANAQLLEMVGDIPYEDVKPPDSVLFVCKLNPVTTDEDLEMIFSRFGPIVSCEVIKDHKTKESLQYAFVEFEKPEDCENAYFKMDNVLIDDRRIHVDFSQSVSKIKPSAGGKKPEEDKKDKDDQPKYVLKDQQRKDDKYDLVFEHDHLPEASAETKKSKKHKHRKHSGSEDEGEPKEKKKKKEKRHRSSRSRSRSRSPRGGEKDRSVGRESRDTRNAQLPERKRDRRRSSSSQEDKRKERKKERSPSSEEDRRKEKKKERRSPSSEEDVRKERKRKDRRSVSPDEDKRKKRKKDRRSPSSEEDGRKKKKKDKKSSSSEEDRRKEKKKKDRRSPSTDRDGRKERKKEERGRREQSPSPHRDRGDRR